MRNIGWILALGLFVTNAQAVSVADAKRTISAQLKDPASVQFRNVRSYKRTGAVCGEYNAKNSYGGYVGFAPFGVSSDGSLMDAPQVEGLSGSYAQAALKQFLKECEGE